MFLGDESGALHWLDRVIENREGYRLGHIRCAHYLDALRPESGFRAIVERLDDRERAGSPLREVVLAALGWPEAQLRRSLANAEQRAGLAILQREEGMAAARGSSFRHANTH